MKDSERGELICFIIHIKDKHERSNMQLYMYFQILSMECFFAASALELQRNSTSSSSGMMGRSMNE